MAESYRVGVIGHTGQGNYGHGLDRVWLEIPNTRIVGVADPDNAGLSSAVERLGNPNGYADYREMLEKERPDVVSICPRWLNRHHEYVVAAAERGVRGIYLEKPLCQTLEQADSMIETCRKHRVKVAVAHQTRYSPILPVIDQAIDAGRIGTVLEFRGRGKEDRRGGGEDLWVLGTHVFDLIRYFGGDAIWCSASVEDNGRPVISADVSDGNEGIGALAGDHVAAMYGLRTGRKAYFNSTRNMAGTPSRFGLMIYGSKGVIALTTGFLPAAAVLEDPSWTPGRTNKKWVPISSAGVGMAEPLQDGGLHAGNLLACRDLLGAIEQDRDPESSILEARAATEMIVAVFEAHRRGRKVEIPLVYRKNPLLSLEPGLGLPTRLQ